MNRKQRSVHAPECRTIRRKKKKKKDEEKDKIERKMRNVENRSWMEE